MLKRDAAAFPILVSLAVGLAEAIVKGEAVALPPQVTDVLHEWLETPHGQSHFAVQELSRDMRERPSRDKVTQKTCVFCTQVV